MAFLNLNGDPELLNVETKDDEVKKSKTRGKNTPMKKF